MRTALRQAHIIAARTTYPSGNKMHVLATDAAGSWLVINYPLRHTLRTRKLYTPNLPVVELGSMRGHPPPAFMLMRLHKRTPGSWFQPCMTANLAHGLGHPADVPLR